MWTGGHATPAEAVAAYRKQAASKSDVERQAEAKDKTGVFTGEYAVNPVSGEKVPVFIADYVLMGYGTGAIMAVPAHDARDFEFARAFELPIRCVVEPTDGRGTDPAAWDDAFVSYDAKLVNSAGEGISLDGLGVVEAKVAITEWLAGRGIGEGTVNFRLRDWLFSRQRYWGEPSRSSTTRTASRTPCPSRCCRWSCPRSRTTRRAPSSPTTRPPGRRPRCRATRRG